MFLVTLVKTSFPVAKRSKQLVKPLVVLLRRHNGTTPFALMALEHLVIPILAHRVHQIRSINMSLSFERYGENEAILQCSSSRQMLFDGRNLTRNVVIRFSGLTFLNSHVTVQNCSLYVDSCHFKDAMSFPNATGVVHFESFDEHDLSLRVGRSKFFNNSFPCIYVLGSRPKIEIYETAFINNTANGRSALFSWIDLCIFMVLFSTEHLKYPGISVSLTSISFVENRAPLGGCLHMEGIISGETKGRHFPQNRKNRTSIKNANTTSSPLFPRQSTATGQLLVSISEGTFSNNFGRAITFISLNRVNTLIAKCSFFNNSSPSFGGAIFFYEVGQFLNVIDSEFVKNSAESCGSAICSLYLSLTSPSEVYSVLVRKTLFMGNVIRVHDPSFYGGALAVDCPYCNNMTVLLEEVSFMYNSANNGCSVLRSDAGETINITIVDSFFIGNSLQDERISDGWTSVAHTCISSHYLCLFIIRTLISENYAERFADKNALKGRPFVLSILSRTRAEININGLQYTNNKGSGIYIEVNGAVNSSLSVTNAHFEDNELFSIYFSTGGKSLLQMKNMSFKRNSHTNASIFFFHSLVRGNKVTINDAIFENNTTPGETVLFQLPPDNVDHAECHKYCYDYKNEVRLNNVLFRENKAINPSIIRLESGWNVLSKCRFVDNKAPYTVFVGESSTSLELTDTSFHKSSQWKDTFRGFIYYASSGPIKLKNTTLKAKAFQDIDS